VKPFIGTLRVTNPVRQSRASSRKRVLHGERRLSREKSPRATRRNLGTASPERRQRRESFQRALALYQAGEWSEAARVVLPIRTAVGGGYDLPGLTLLGRAVECLKAASTSFDPALELKSK
jgi:hypothetical protein